MKKRLACSTLVACLVVANASAAGLESLVEDCNGCHGDDGVSQWNDVPTISGIDAFVHSEALYIYQDEARPCSTSAYRQGDTTRLQTSMCAIAQSLDDDQVEALSAYYSELPFVPAKQAFDADLATAGQGIHERDCGLCHTDGGSNPEDESSILAGQWMDYLKSTIGQYRAGEREQPGRMQEKLDALSDDDVEALLHFYASQQ